MKTGDYRLPRHTVLMAHNLLISAVLTRIVELASSAYLSWLLVAHTSRVDSSLPEAHCHSAACRWSTLAICGAIQPP